MSTPEGPIGPDREFKPEALEKKFSYSFNRKQLIILVGILRPIQLPIGDMRTGVLLELLGEIERTAIQSINSDDYMPEKNDNNIPPKVSVN